MVEVMKIMVDLLQKVPCMHSFIQCLQPCSRPLLTHDSARDSWTLTGKSGSVSCGVTAALSWVLVHTRLCVCSPRVYFPVLCKFWQLYGGVNGDLLQEGLCHTQASCTQSPCPCGSPLLICTSAGFAQTQFWLSLWGLWVLVHTKFVWALWAFLVGMGFESKHDFAPPTIFLGLLLCSWAWGISLQFLKHCTAAASSGPITSWQIDGQTVETVADFILGGSKITADDEIKRCLLLERKVMTNLDSIFKSRDITLPTKVR